MNTEIIHGLISFFPEVSIVLIVLITLILGLYGSFSKASWWIAGIFVLAILSLSYNNSLLISPPILGGIANDGISLWLKSVILCYTLLILLFYGGMTRVKVWDHAHHEFVVIILIASLGAMVTVSARNFLILYIALEIVSLSSYILAAYDRDMPYSAEAGTKYFILGSLASCIIIFGMSYIYGFSGTLSYSSIQILFTKGLYSAGLVTGICILLVGILFKLSIVPFHFWLPDVYQGSPFISVAYFASIPKLAAVAALFNIISHVIGDVKYIWSNMFVYLAIASMVVGGVGAIVQTSLKRLMGYSTILNMGFILLSLATDTTEGIVAAIMYQILYAIGSIGLFATLAITIVPNAEDYPISNLAGFGSVKKLAAFCISVFMFSMVGVPPLAGFFAKFYVIEASMRSHFYVASVVALLITVVSAFYYINVVRVIYFNSPTIPQIRLHESSALAFVISVCTVVTLLFPVLQHWL